MIACYLRDSMWSCAKMSNFIAAPVSYEQAAKSTVRILKDLQVASSVQDAQNECRLLHYLRSDE